METINETLVASLKIIEPAETVEQSLARVLEAQVEEKRHRWEDEDTYFDSVAAHQDLQEIETEIDKVEEMLSLADNCRTFSTC